ncbi:MAG: T9SS type A sorting domain-containing protein [Chitinophagaceae bacterium]|nr:T9SS type A sorting domain-containing protein [Chitinophagaceae bacterium]
MKRITLGLMTILSCIGFSTGFAQEVKRCGSTEAEQALFEKHPELRPQINSLNDYLNSLDHSKLEKNRAGDYIIPLVFHVIHNYGPENISDAQIYDAVKVLNEDYQKRNADTAAIIPQFKAIAANVGYEFRLATKDPEGNCTNGIDRIVSYKTYKADDESKLNPWPRNNYFNIWTINSMASAGTAGYAYKPATANFLFYYDGIIIIHEYVGSIGTGNPGLRHALGHEVGHCLNLDHPWGATNQPGVSCGDDAVGDTPKTMGHDDCLALYDTYCSTLTGGTPIVENVQNFMEYSYCSNMFTEGQAARMDVSLNATVAQRNSLISTQAANFSGILLPKADCAPIADFSVNRNFVCVGGSPTFKNQSYRDTVSSVQWDFPTGNPSTSTNTSQQAVVYNTPGWQTVTLTANSNAGSNTSIKNNFIYVSDPNDLNQVGTVNSFEDINDYARWPIFNYYNNDFKWQYYDQGYVQSGWRCLMFKGFDDRPFPANLTLTPRGDKDEIISPAYNTSGLTAGNAYLNFFVAAATQASIITQMDDSLIVYYSSNCGTGWTKLKTLATNSLINNGSSTSAFYPNANTIWSPVSIALPSGALANPVYFKMTYLSGGRSNNAFIDNFEVNSTPAAVKDLSKGTVSFNLVPNPSTEGTTVIVDPKNAEQVSIAVTDLLGRTIYSETLRVTNSLSVSHVLPAELFQTKGMYYVTVNINHAKSTQKLLIQ